MIPQINEKKLIQLNYIGNISENIYMFTFKFDIFTVVIKILFY